MLIRLSTEYQSEYLQWIESLESCGCTRRDTYDDLSALSPRPLQVSPAASGVSDSDTASSHRGGAGLGGGQEADSEQLTAPTQPNQMLQRTPSGYTSDQSDVGQSHRARLYQSNHTHHHHHHHHHSTVGSARDGDARGRTGGGSSTEGGGKHGSGRKMIGNETCSPVHMQPRFSLLSSERITVMNQQGLLTLVFIVLAATNFRLILENMIKYGLRFNPFSFIRTAVTPSGNAMLALCWPSLLVFSLLALGIEKFACRCLMAELNDQTVQRKKKDLPPNKLRRRAVMKARLTENVVFMLNAINTTAELLVPFYVIHITNAEPLPGFVLTMATTVLWLKLVSYAHVNWSLRRLKRIDPVRRCPGETGSGSEPLAVETDDMVYPLNLTINNLGYFLAAPTLCYQLSYPRSPRFRFRWVLRRMLMFMASLGWMLFITEQYIEPTIENSLKPLQEMVC